MRTVCFVTCARWPELSQSDRQAQRALESRGVTVEPRAWNDPTASFASFGAVVLRSNWDYHFAPDAFLGWLDRWADAGVAIWNPPPLVRWNLTKRYLLDLAAAGLPVVPTIVLDGAPERLPALLAQQGWTTAVVKPVVSASAHDTVLVTRPDAARVAAAIAAGEIRGPVLVQPFIEDIRTRGEWSLIFIDGIFTHAVLKHPAPHDFRVQPSLGGRAEATAPSPAVLEAGARVLAALPSPSLYARIDGVEQAGVFRVMEVELNEPGLFFTHAPAAAEAFAEAVCRRLGKCPERLSLR